MVKQIVRTELSFFARRCASAALLASGFWGLVATARAQATLPPISIGAGMRTSYVHTFPDSGTDSDRFLLNSARIYINGSVTDTFKFTLNTEYNSSTNNVNVLDAIARMEVSPEFNIWAGRLLPPSDRVNLTGPYYSHHWAVFTDGIENGQPSAFQGRDNGFLYWGDFANKRLKISAGAFDGPSTDGSPEVLGAARVQIDLWDTEPGYYLNSTYYGDKNILAIAGSNQVQGGRTATTVDFLLEKKIMGGGAFSLEGEYAAYNKLGGYDSNYRDSQGVWGLASVLFPKVVGPGKFEILGKYAKADFTRAIVAAPSYNQKTTEVNVNYIIKQFNARIMTFFENTSYSRLHTDFKVAGLGLQFQL